MDRTGHLGLITAMEGVRLMTCSLPHFQKLLVEPWARKRKLMMHTSV